MDSPDDRRDITPNSTDSQQGMSLKKSYAGATSSDSFPSKEQAIVIEAQEGLSIKDYVSKVASIVDASNIRFVSRISNNRICIFLSSQAVADKFTDKNKTIVIKNRELNVRPLISKLKRVIISNVCPIIPHDIIEKEFIKRKITPSSKISFIKAGISEPGFSHIMSFRRQVYIEPEDLNKLPDSTVVYFDNTSYRIYFSTDIMTCFICNQEGHVAQLCPSKPSGNDEMETELTQQHNQSLSSVPNLQPADNINGKVISPSADMNITSKIPSPSDSSTQIEEAIHTKESEDNPLKKELEANNNALILTQPQSVDFPALQTSQSYNPNSTNNLIKKRPISLSSTTSDPPIEPSSEPDKHFNNDLTAKEKEKNYKKSRLESSNIEESEKLDTQLAPLKEILMDPNNKYPLNFIQMKSFLEKTKNSTEVIEIALEFTPDVTQMIQMLERTYPKLKDKNMKRRFTNLKKKLNKHIKSNESEYSSDTS